MKSLIKALDMGYSYRPDEMLRFLLVGIRELWGLKTDERVPDDAKQRISDAIGAYGDLVAKSEPFVDLLGPLYMDLASSKAGRQHLGQFFTPWPIARMMSAMTDDMPGPKALAERGRLTSILDPACGSGVMLLSSLSHTLEQCGADSLRHISVTGVDIDRICAGMAATQLIANCNVHGLQVGEVLILRGDSLRMNGFETVVHASAPEVLVAPAAEPARLEAIRQAAMSQQLSLFGEDAA